MKPLLPDQPIPPSKSEKKRNCAALQKIGEKLCALPAPLRKKMELPLDLAEALEELDRITHKEGARRQRQYIGRLMREVDPEELLAALETFLQKDPSQSLLLSIREELLSLGKAQSKKPDLKK